MRGSAISLSIGQSWLPQTGTEAAEMNPCPELQVTPHPQPPPQGSPRKPVRQSWQGSPFTDDLTQAPQALPGPHTHCLCSTVAATTPTHRGTLLEKKLALEGRRPYLAGELPLQRLQLLPGPAGGAPLLAHAGAQLVHLPQELPLRQLQLLDSAAGSRRRLVRRHAANTAGGFHTRRTPFLLLLSQFCTRTQLHFVKHSHVFF